MFHLEMKDRIFRYLFGITFSYFNLIHGFNLRDNEYLFNFFCRYCFFKCFFLNNSFLNSCFFYTMK